MENQANVLNQDKGYNVSNRYKVISTQNVLDHFQDAGFKVESMSTAGVRKAEKQGFQKHLIRLSHPETSFKLNGLRPEIVLKNAYDGSTCFNLRIGVYRFLCANGLEVGSTYRELKVKHLGSNILERVVANAHEIMGQFPVMQDQIEAMQGRELSQIEIVQFAQSVGQYLISKRDNATDVDASGLLTLRRGGDRQNDLFTMLNVIQENALKGSYRYTAEIPVPDTDGITKLVHRKGRRVKSIDRTSEINTKVWDAATQFLNAA